MSRRTWVVRGRVQGVFFRQGTREQLARLALSGSAVNRPDGTVEVQAEGDDAALDELQAWLHVGPPRALVTELRRLS